MSKTSTNVTTEKKAVPYDVAEQLRTPQEVAAYLDAWLTEAPDDISGIAREQGDIGRSSYRLIRSDPSTNNPDTDL